jgi:hypothetical protein
MGGNDRWRESAPEQGRAADRHPVPNAIRFGWGGSRTGVNARDREYAAKNKDMQRIGVRF